MRPTLEDAIRIAADAHRGQLYPAPNPEPYILHPLRVMLDVRSPDARIVAVLHDIGRPFALTAAFVAFSLTGCLAAGTGVAYAVVGTFLRRTLATIALACVAVGLLLYALGIQE